MESKKSVDVVINGRLYTLSGYEEQDYLQKVAAYINGKLAEMQAQSAFSKQTADMQNILLQLNIADDYFKEKAENKELAAKLKEQDKELYSLKHELVSLKMKQSAGDN